MAGYFLDRPFERQREIHTYSGFRSEDPDLAGMGRGLKYSFQKSFFTTAPVENHCYKQYKVERVKVGHPYEIHGQSFIDSDLKQ